MRILLPTDGSEGAWSAVRCVAAMRLPPGSEVRLLAVRPEPASPESLTHIAAAREELAGPGREVSARVRLGVPAEEILKAEEEDAPDLTVLGSRGLSAVARFWIGSVAERVAQYSRGPVLLVWPGHTVLRRALLALDGSAASAGAVRWMERFPLPDDGEVHLTTFITMMDVFSRWRRTLLPPANPVLRLLERQASREAEQRLEKLAGAFRERGLTVRTHVRSGDPAEGLPRLAAEVDADLLVTGSHGRGLLGSLLLGSVSDRMLEETSCSVLVVKRRPE